MGEQPSSHQHRHLVVRQPNHSPTFIPVNICSTFILNTARSSQRTYTSIGKRHHRLTKGVRQFPSEERQDKGNCKFRSNNILAKFAKIMNVDEKRVEKCYPTMQELEGIQWNNWEEHLNVQNYRIFTFQRALHKIVAFLMVWLYGEQKCESFEKGKATITEIMFGNGHEAPRLLHHLWLRKCLWCRQPRSGRARQDNGHLILLNLTPLSLVFGGGHQLLPAYEICVSLSGPSHTPARQRPVRAIPKLCCKRRGGWSTDELCRGKVKTTAAKMSVVNSECSVFTVWGEKSEKWPLFVDMSMADRMQFRNTWFKIESKLE